VAALGMSTGAGGAARGALSAASGRATGGRRAVRDARGARGTVV